MQEWTVSTPMGLASHGGDAWVPTEVSFGERVTSDTQGGIYCHGGSERFST